MCVDCSELRPLSSLAGLRGGWAGCSNETICLSGD